MFNPYHLPQYIFNGTVWQIKNSANNLFLTFDDGPNPATTPYVLDILDKKAAKATFFCIGKNVDRYSNLYDEIIKRGHAVGNHTYSHLKGWHSSNQEYYDNIQLASQYIESNLFRPPYGQMTLTQIKHLKTLYKIIFWSVLSWDFNESLSAKSCIKRVLPKTQSGDIIVFHDSKKAFHRMHDALPMVVDALQKNDYNFLTIK